jgi:hypothetical protein
MQTVLIMSMFTLGVLLIVFSESLIRVRFENSRGLLIQGIAFALFIVHKY